MREQMFGISACSVSDLFLSAVKQIAQLISPELLVLLEAIFDLDEFAELCLLALRWSPGH